MKRFEATTKKNTTRVARWSKKKRAALAIGCGIVLLAAILEFTNTTYLFHKKISPITASENTKGEPTSPSTATNSKSTSGNKTAPSQSSTAGSDQKSNAGTVTPTAQLLPPSGDFVSSHHLSLGNQPVISSVCTTTPGATCTISFSKDGINKSLTAETTDAGGSAYWDWKLQDKDINLTAGSWQITATATLGSQTQTAADALTLEVSP